MRRKDLVVIQFHLIKLRCFCAFWLQLHVGCSNLRVAEIPCFAGSIKKGRREQGYLFGRLPTCPIVAKRGSGYLTRV